jgi:SWI/SNF-related matrix-associated actin-dependent regulator of chromatin subfamily A-like protein 1
MRRSQQLAHRESELEAQQRESVRTAIRKDPFSVSEAQIEIASPDVVIRLHSLGTSLRAHAGSRRGRAVLESLYYTPHVRSEGAFLLPTEQIRPFIKHLAAEHTVFAVAEEAGARLKASASLRASIMDGSYAPSEHELRDALLTPILHVSHEAFSLLECSTPHLAALFPDEQSHARRRRMASSLSVPQVLDALRSCMQRGMKIWMTKEAHDALERCTIARAPITEGFPEHILALRVPVCAWICGGATRGGLLISDECFQRTNGGDDGVWSPEQHTIHPWFPGYWYITVPNAGPRAWYIECQAYLRGKGIDAPSSAEFLDLMAEYARREERRRQRDYYLSLDDTEVGLVDHELESKLFPHQRIAVHWLLRHDYGFLGDDMGLGKTITVLAALDERRRRGDADFFLVVCPNSLVRNWLREAAQWTPELSLFALPKGKSAREKALGELSSHGPCGVVVNYETVRIPEVARALLEHCRGRTSVLCLDESQRVKNAKGQTFHALNGIAGECPYRVLMSGTPTPRELSDIWAQMALLDRGERFGTHYIEWLKTVAELGNEYSEIAVRRYIPERINVVIDRVHEVLLRRRKEEVTNLPPKLFSVRDVELESDQRRRYDEIREELLIRISKTDGREFVKAIDSILEEYLRAVQIASNPRLIDETWQGTPAKFRELDTIVDEVVGERGEKLVIWTNYVTNVRELTARYREHRAAPFFGGVDPKERAETVKAFQSDSTDSPRILVAVPAAGGVGITLTAAQTAVYVEKSWNAEHWLQSVDRIHRIGQRGTVHIISLHACKIDEAIAANLRRKERLQARLLQGVPLEDGDDASPSREELIAAVLE